MTYSIAAPRLYKEVVVNSLSSFFLGVDNSVQPYHQDCIVQLSNQSHLCHLMRKRDGTPYICPRHKPQLDTTSTATPPPTVFALYHKQELLAMVKALHFVYASADQYIYNKINLNGWPQDGEHVSRLIKLCDVQRYEDVTACTKGVTGHFNPLPILKRVSVGRWTEDMHWNMDHIMKHVPSLSGNVEKDTQTASSIIRDFEEHLAASIPPLRPRFMCRHYGRGPLAIYPGNIPGDVELNILHDLCYTKYYACLVPGTFNIIRIGSDPHFSAIDLIENIHVYVASRLYFLVLEWSESYSPDIIGKTFIRFVLDRGKNADGPENVDNRTVQMVQSLNAVLASLLDPPGDLPVQLMYVGRMKRGIVQLVNLIPVIRHTRPTPSVIIYRGMSTIKGRKLNMQDHAGRGLDQEYL